MAERRRTKQSRQIEQAKPSKEDYTIAKYLRFNVKAYDAKLHGNDVKYFVASEAVDALLKSKWALDQDQGGMLLTSRASCTTLMNSLLQKGCLFYRAEKLERKKLVEERREGRGKKVNESLKKEKSDKETKEKAGTGDHVAGENDEKKKKVRKVRLRMHEMQVFKDGEELFVWIYDPVSVKTFVIGLLLLLGVIAICLFPLWPPEVRIGISYLSWIAIGLLGIIFALYIVRLAVFVVVWCGSSGTRHFWLFPNLNEDVGFWELFTPLYVHKLATDEPTKNVCRDSKTDNEPGASPDLEIMAESAVETEPVLGEQKPSDYNGVEPAEGEERSADNEEGDEEEEEDSDEASVGGHDRDAGTNSDDDEELGGLEHRDAGDDDLDLDINNDFEIIDAESDSDEDKKDK